MSGHSKWSTIKRQKGVTDAKTLAHLLKYDSILGNLAEEVKAEGDVIHVAGRKVKVLAIKDQHGLGHIDLDHGGL